MPKDSPKVKEMKAFRGNAVDTIMEKMVVKSVPPWPPIGVPKMGKLGLEKVEIPE